MKLFTRRLTPIVGLLAALAVCATLPASAQNTETKEKPRLYTYVSNWVIPRGRWEDMQKAAQANQKILDGAVAGGSILGYGDNETLVHQLEGPTHNDWWIANSMAGVLGVLDEFYKSKTAVSPVLASATRHWDNIYVSRFYDWRSGSVKSGYLHGAVYKLKESAPDNAVESLSKTFVVPLFEKLMAEGSVQAYQVAEEAIHTSDPSMFFVFFMTSTAQGLDKTNAALGAVFAGNPMLGPALGSMVDGSAHRDSLARTNAVFK
ncbi:MAG: hypothetical protein JSR67_15125 [Proteobacteria bacterium]|nr:hypothetical protein [Pseudomonadota bacterium]